MQHHGDERVELVDGTYAVCRGRRVVLQQDFTWHDAGASDYDFGKDGYLAMDGIRFHRPIRCLRRLKHAIGSSDGAIELHVRVVIGRRYFVRLYDGGGWMVVNCCLDSDGWVKLIRGDGCDAGHEDVDTGAYLTWAYGYPAVDPAFSASHTVESDLHVLKFSNFDFGGGSSIFNSTPHRSAASMRSHTPASTSVTSS